MLLKSYFNENNSCIMHIKTLLTIISFSFLLISCVGKYSTENYVPTEVFDEYNGGLYVDGVSTSYGIDVISDKLEDMGVKLKLTINDVKLFDKKNPSEEIMRILTYNVFDDEIYKMAKYLTYRIYFSENKRYLLFMYVELCDEKGKVLKLSYANKVHSNDRLADMCDEKVNGKSATCYINKDNYGFRELDDDAELVCMPFQFEH